MRLRPTPALLRGILAFSIVSTALHYTHNFVEVDNYPIDFAGGPAVQVAILVLWPLVTVIGLLGYRLFVQGSFPLAQVCLATYSVLGLSSLGHFLEDSPDIRAFFFATIFTDGLAGLAVLSFAVWSLRTARRPATT